MEGIVKGKASYSTKGASCLILKWFIILLFAVHTLFPLLWLLITSLKANAGYFDDPFPSPAVPQFQNHINAFSQASLGQMIWSSVTVAVTTTTTNVFMTAMASYAILRLNFKGKGIFFIIFSVGVMVPLNTLTILYLTIFSRIGLLDSMNVLRVLYTAIGLLIAVIIIRGFMNSLPREVKEAAYIDGCGFFRRFPQIILPLSKTGLITAATFQFIAYWNGLVCANLPISSSQDKMIQIGIRYFINQFTTNYVLMYAAVIIATILSVLGYALFQKQIISDVTSDAVKG